MELYESYLRIVHDPGGVAETLLDFGDLLTSEKLQLEGSQEVQVSDQLRALAVRVYPRGNAMLRLEFSVVERCESKAQSLTSMLNYGTTVPRGAASVQIHTTTGECWELGEAVVENWQSSSTGNVSQRQVRIIGGQISKVGSTVIPSADTLFTSTDSHQLTVDAVG